MTWTLLLICLCLTGSAHLSRGDAAHCNAHMLKLNGTTSQSSQYAGEGVAFSSERAIDGNETQCAHTLQQPNSWWRIDLLEVYKISCVRIYNVQQQNIDITGAQIYIGNSLNNNGTSNSMCKNITNFQLNQWNNFPCNSDVSGRYVSVFSPGNKILALCEVKIYINKGSHPQNSPFVLVQENKTWEEALLYCRDKHETLASIVDNDTQVWAELEAKKAHTPFVWLGLRYSCTLEFWFWVDDQCVGFSRWATGNQPEGCDRSGVMETRGEHLWFKKFDSETFNFICAKKKK